MLNICVAVHTRALRFVGFKLREERRYDNWALLQWLHGLCRIKLIPGMLARCNLLFTIRKSLQIDTNRLRLQ